MQVTALERDRAISPNGTRELTGECGFPGQKSPEISELGRQEVCAGASKMHFGGIPSKSPVGEVVSWVGNVAFFDEERS